MFAIQAVCIGWAAITIDSPNLAAPIMNILFALYVLVLAVRSLNQNNTNGHFESIVHISTLLFFASLLLGAIGIMPSDATVILLEENSIPISLWYTVLFLYLAAFLVAINVPRGPPLHFSPSNIYLEKTVEAITNKNEDNVCGTVSASIWDIFLFSYTTKV